MTITECMKKRIRADDKMCKKINEIIDGIDKGDDPYGYPYAIGMITAVMEHANRREGEEDDCFKSFSDDDNRRLAAFLNKDTAAKKTLVGIPL